MDSGRDGISHKWQNRDGNRNVPYLNWNGDQWILNFNWLENDWNSNDRLVSPRNSLVPTLYLEGPVFRVNIFQPAAEHSAYFRKKLRQMDVFFIFNPVYFPEYFKEEFQRVQYRRCSLQI